MKDYHVIVNAKGQVVASASGPPIELQKGWEIRYYDYPYEVEQDPIIQRRRVLDAAEDTLIAIGAMDRTQALIAKAAEAKAFCAAYPEPFDESRNTDPDVIDSELYPILYEEYWETFDKVEWSPHELAISICNKAAAKSSEGKLRRQKLIAEQEYKDNQ